MDALIGNFQEDTGLTDRLYLYIYQLLREVSPKRRSRRQLAQLDQRKPYITACFRQLPTSFTVGSDHRHSSCENKALEPGQEYVFFLLAELNATAGVSYYLKPFIRLSQTIVICMRQTLQKGYR